MNNWIVFDIETGPETSDVLEKFFHYDETLVPDYDLIGKTFDVSEVKTGNLKDQVKIDEKIAKAKEKFEQDQRAAHLALLHGEKIAWQKFVGSAPLSAIQGRVLAVGLYCSAWEQKTVIAHLEMFAQGERELIEYLLNLFESVIKEGGRIIGHNIFHFDLPFLIRRAFKFHLPIPPIIVQQIQQWAPTSIIDTMRVWQCGDRREMVKLNDLALHLGTTVKNGNGAMFHKDFNGTPEMRQRALEYLKNDVQMTVEIAEKLGVYTQ